MRIGVAIFLAAMTTPAMAQTMNADQFYQRATALKKKGAMAIFSGSEIKALMAEGQAAGKPRATSAWRRRKRASRSVTARPTAPKT